HLKFLLHTHLLYDMEVGRDFINTPPVKTVRFGDTVVNTLAKLKQGDTSDYEMIKHQLSDPDIKRLPWLGRTQAVVDEYLAFLSNLVSAQTVHLRPCLKMVFPTVCPFQMYVDLPRIFEHCHQALQMIARYVPSTSRFLMPILTENFPFVQKSPRTLECYVHNLLRITVYVPALRKDVLELIVSKMLALDVSAPRSEIEEVESSGEQDQGGKAHDDFLFDMDEDEDSAVTSPTGLHSSAMLHPVAERLDTLMGVLLAFVKDMCHVNGSLDTEKAKALYRDLVGVFDRLVLPTHASCHVQYYMFYLCSFRLGLAEAFLDHLWKLLQNPSQPPITRQASASYMGSFLARAKFLPVATVKACLDLLVSWLHLYIDSQDSGLKAFCDVSLHGPFYAACQAVFYTLIFRHKAILEGSMKAGLDYLQRLNLERIVMCRLNPLKVCLPAVTNMFAAITRKYQLVFCYTIMERNNRCVLPVVRSSVGGDSLSTNTNPLDTFFPFDPYLLKRSRKLFESIYQVWEEPSDCALDVRSKDVRKAPAEDEDDFLHGQTPQGDMVMGGTPGSYEAHLASPSSMGSPPIAFLQRRF
uniref:RRN3 homolog, RNA polymerase I transcription factor n=1 Tax=Electrophorus electricus TaxID=8005 RepID=A0A4W4G176_ELEEL